MKKYLYFLLVMSCFPAGAQTVYQLEDVRLFDDKMVDMQNNPISGVVQSVWENNQIKKEIPYQNGVKNGEEKWFYENGTPRFIVHWVNGEKTGTLEEFRKDGTPQQLRTYKNGIKDGMHIKYHRNGQEDFKVLFRDGQKQQMERISDTGAQIAVASLNQSEAQPQQDQIVYYKNGGKKFQLHHDASDKSVKAQLFYRTGGLAFELTQKDEQYEGTFYSLTGEKRAMTEDETNSFVMLVAYGIFMAPDEEWNDKLMYGMVR